MNYSKCIHSNRQWLHVKYITEKRSLRNIAKLCGCSFEAIYKTLIRYRIKRRVVGFRKGRKSRCINWKGGKTIINGYEMIFIGRYICKDGRKRPRYGFVHRIVAAKILGRKLKRSEVIHHIDHNPLNNHPENLFLFKNNAEHKLYEQQFKSGKTTPLKSNLSMNG